MISSLKQIADAFERRGEVHGLWDLDREAPSLGGLLLLRSELEQLATACSVSRIGFSFRRSERSRSVAGCRLVSDVIQSSCSFFFPDSGSEPLYWPAQAYLESPDFSYQFFDRVSELFRYTGRRPTLAWSEFALSLANYARKSFSPRLFTVHLKHAPSAGSDQSNADQESWFHFFAQNANPGKSEFLLLGSDKVSKKIENLPGVHIAQNLGLSLTTQLALVSMSDGFIGMASGICAAAVLSEVPYVLFKNPKHHEQEMQRQIGSGDSFAFSGPRQRIWRAQDTPTSLSRGFVFICG